MAASDAEIGQRIEGIAGRFLVTRGDFNALVKDVQDIDSEVKAQGQKLDQISGFVTELQGVPGLVDVLRGDVQSFGGQVRGLTNEVGAILQVLEMGPEAVEAERGVIGGVAGGMILRQDRSVLRRRSRRLDRMDSSITGISDTIKGVTGDIGTIDRDITDINGRVEGLGADLDSHVASARPLLDSIPGIRDKLVGLDGDIDTLGSNLSGLGSDLASHVQASGSRFDDIEDQLPSFVTGSQVNTLIDSVRDQIPTDQYIIGSLVRPNLRTDGEIVTVLKNQFNVVGFDIDLGRVRGTSLRGILDSIQDQIDDWSLPSDFTAIWGGLKDTFWGTGARLRTKVVAEEGALRSLRTGFADTYQRFGSIADSAEELRKSHKSALQNAKNWLDALRDILDDAIYGGGDGIRPSRKTFLANLDTIKNGIKARYDAAIATFENHYGNMKTRLDELEKLFYDMGGNLKTLADSELNLLNSQKLGW